jgi:multisubunit Na+/H+ antiporter MnhG subunit
VFGQGLFGVFLFMLAFIALVKMAAFYRKKIEKRNNSDK